MCPRLLFETNWLFLPNDRVERRETECFCRMCASGNTWSTWTAVQLSLFVGAWPWNYSHKLMFLFEFGLQGYLWPQMASEHRDGKACCSDMNLLHGQTPPSQVMFIAPNPWSTRPWNLCSARPWGDHGIIGPIFLGPCFNSTIFETFDHIWIATNKRAWTLTYWPVEFG